MTARLDIASGFQPLMQEKQGHMELSPVKGHQGGHGTGADGLGGRLRVQGWKRESFGGESDNDLHYL